MPSPPGSHEIADLENRLAEALATIDELASGQNEDTYKSIADLSPDGVMVHTDGIIQYGNASLANLFGVPSADDLIGKESISFIAPEERERVHQRRKSTFQNEVLVAEEARFIRMDGSDTYLERTTSQISWNGAPSLLVMFRDVNSRRAARETQRETEQRYRGFIENYGLGIHITKAEGGRLFLNDALVRLLGYGSLNEINNLPDFTIIAPHDRDLAIAKRLEAAKNPGAVIQYECEFQCKDGSTIPLHVLINRIKWEGEEAVLRTVIDLSERKQAEDALRESEGTLRAFIDNSPSIIYVRDTQSRILKINKAYEDFHNITEAEALGKVGHEWLGEKLGRQTIDGDKQVLSTGQPMTINFENTDFEGRTHYMQAIKFPIFDDGGAVVAVGGIANDVTEHREREEQLSQAQKMDAVGQLTGGIAHDFNNLLTVVIGNIELAQEGLASGGDIAPLLIRAQDGALRGATLTQRLLAFSRKQDLRPQDIDACELVIGMTDLLQRSLGETIEIDTISHKNLWLCKADQSQLENAVLNLAINARDAMPHGGKLTIETNNIILDDDYAAAQAELEPGEYVTVAVTDTGTGMSAEIMEKAFEPFYTTKRMGAGSGLGLSMVYGFVKQSNGQVTIYSEENKGTTVKLYLPRSGVIDERTQSVKPEDAPTAGVETILVVEDDSDVRTLTVALLSQLGYEILEAADANSALKALDNSSRINLLFSDVVLPGGMSGPELAAEVLRRRPGTAILHTSGYTEHAALKHMRLQDGVGLLNKPFKTADLAKMVRAALDKSKL